MKPPGKAPPERSSAARATTAWRRRSALLWGCIGLVMQPATGAGAQVDNDVPRDPTLEDTVPPQAPPTAPAEPPSDGAARPNGAPEPVGNPAATSKTASTPSTPTTAAPNDATGAASKPAAMASPATTPPTTVDQAAPTPEAESTTPTATEEDGWGEETGADEDGWGQEGGSTQSGDEWGFAERVAEGADAAGAEGPPPGQLSVSGFLRHRVGLWIERLNDRPLAKQRQSVDLSLRYKRSLFDEQLMTRIVADGHVEYDFAYLVDRDDFDRATLDAYETQVIGGETFIGLSYEAFEVSFGRQIVAWGQGEMLSPLDIVNPRDQREPGLADLDDIRMAVLATKAGLFFGAHRFEIMVVHESFFGLRPAPLSEFSPLRKLIASDPQAGALLSGRQLRYRDVPSRFVESAGQVYGRWAYTGAGVDLALYAASTLDKGGVAQLPGPSALSQQDIALSLWHPRYTMLGHAGAKPVDDFILRWEVGADLDRGVMVQDDDSDGLNFAMARREQLNWMAGVTYSGVTDATLGVEYTQSFVFDNPDRDATSLSLLSPLEAPALGVRYSQTFLRETLQLSAAINAFGLETFLGLVARAEVQYELRDALKISLGYVTFQPSSDTFGPLYGMDEHDRLFASLRWDFLL